VDLPPDELIKRLRQGKVYVPELVVEAIDKFFRKGNLIALRELSMRAAAERVDDQVRTYMGENAIPASMANFGALLYVSVQGWKDQSGTPDAGWQPNMEVSGLQFMSKPPMICVFLPSNRTTFRQPKISRTSRSQSGDNTGVTPWRQRIGICA